MKKRSSKYSLVLAGGGSKGAYQLGAWKAMKEIGIEFDAVAGVSIGSINGALVVMDDFDLAVRLWDSVAVEKGVRISEELPDPDNLFSRANWPALFRELVKNGGLDASPAQEFFSNFIDEERVRKSKIDYGLVTIDVDRGAPVRLFKDEIPNGQLLEYILASASVPLTKNIGPEGGRFLDGGAYDNTPVSFMRSHGFNRLVVVDIATFRGVAHEMNLNNCEVVYIRPNDPEALGASFDFSAEMNEKRVKLGYLDTMKAFSCLLGKMYCFEPEVFRSMVKKYGAVGVEQLEDLAYKLGLDNLKVYGEKEFLRAAKALYEKSGEKKSDDEPESATDEAEERESRPAQGDILSRFLSSIGAKDDEDETQRVSAALREIVKEASKRPKEPREDGKGALASLIERFLGEEEEEKEVREFRPAEKHEQKRSSAIGAVLDIMKAKRKSDEDFSMAEEILKNDF